MSDVKLYALSAQSGELICRVPGRVYGDGQVDSDESPVWLLADPDELAQDEQDRLDRVDDGQ